MNNNYWMKKAIELGKTLEGFIFHKPYLSFILVDKDFIKLSWNNLHENLETFLKENSSVGSGALYLPYEFESESLLNWIIKNKINKVIFSVSNKEKPKVLINLLKQKEIEVVEECEKELGERLNEVYFYSFKSTIPFITLSFGMSLDGKIATRTGDSKYISGNKSRQFVHKLRHVNQAILVGINTVLIDHPKLTTRLNGRKGKDPDRIILDSKLRISLEEPLISQDSPAKTIIVTKKDSDDAKKQALKEKGVIIIEINDTEDKLNERLNLHEALEKIKKLGIDSILVEGGSTVHFSFIENRLFNRLYATISPIIIGGENAKSAVGGLGFATLKEATKLDFIKWRKAGNDYILEATIKN